MPLSDDRVCLTPEQARSVLKPGPEVHCFLNPAGILVGADWQLDRVHELIDRSQRIELAGDTAKAMKHGLVVYDGNRPCFFETDEAALDEMERSIVIGRVKPVPSGEV